MAYTHFGARLARLDRFDSCTLYQFFAPAGQAGQDRRRSGKLSALRPQVRLTCPDAVNAAGPVQG